MLKKHWPGVVKTISRAAEHCGQAHDHLLWYQNSVLTSDFKNPLSLIFWKTLPKHLQSSYLRQWMMAMISSLSSTEIMRFGTPLIPSQQINTTIEKNLIQAKEDANPQLIWQNFIIRRFKKDLYIEKLETRTDNKPQLWNPLLQAEIKLNQFYKLTALKKLGEGLKIPKNPNFQIRYRHGGETIQLHGLNKSLKNLFQQWHVPPWKRFEIPLLYYDEQCVAVLGYAIADQWRVGENTEGLVITRMSM